mgnify:FL=1
MNLFEMKENAQKTIDATMPGMVKVTLEKNPDTGKNELTGTYMSAGWSMTKTEAIGPGCEDLFTGFFINRAEYINASEAMQKLAFKNSIHPQSYPAFAKSFAKELGLYND